MLLGELGRGAAESAETFGIHVQPLATPLVRQPAGYQHGDRAIRCGHRSVGPLPTRPTGKGIEVAKVLSKSELIQKIANEHADTVTRKDVKGIIESLATVGHKELKKSGAFVVPGFAKFVVIKKPATKARKGINPFTKEPTIFKARPARKVIKARPVKAIKDAV
jgi:DNA-binding protein HU-beta